MFHVSDLSVFVAALVAVYLVPGPDMALVVSTSALRGLRGGLMVAAGLAAARALHVTLAALGLAALFHTHPLLFDGVRWLGAAYLAWLAWKVLGVGGPGGGGDVDAAQGGLVALRRGFLTNLLNPKALMFCALLLPQFVSPGQGMAGQYLVLGSLLVGIGALFDGAYALAASSLKRRFSTTGATRRLSRIVLSSLFGMAAVRLVLNER